MKKIIVLCFLSSLHASVFAIDWWAVGIITSNMLLFVQRLFTQDPKTERDRVNESIAVHVAVLNCQNASQELKRAALQAILREEEKARCLDIKEYLNDRHRSSEDNELVAWAQKEVQQSGKKILEMERNSL